MKEKLEQVITWIKNNKIVAAIGGIIVLMFLYKKLARKTYRRKRRKTAASPRRSTRSKKSSGSYNRIIKTGRNRGKKAWQIKGSPEARRRMAALRRMRKRKFL